MDNPYKCVGCKECATHICVNSSCTNPPFICLGPCNQGFSLMLHNHNEITSPNKPYYMPLREFLNQVQQIQRKANQHIDTKFFNQIQKIGARIKDSIDYLIKQYTQKISKQTFVIESKSKQILQDFLNRKEPQMLQGKMAYQLLNEQIYKYPELIHSIEYSKNQFKKKLHWFENMFLPDFFSTLTLSYSQSQQTQKIYDLNLNLDDTCYCYELKVHKQICSTTHSILSKYLIKCQRYQEAKKQLQKCIQLNQQNVFSYIEIGLVNQKMLKYDEAILNYSKALTLKNSNHSQLYQLRKNCYLKLHDYPNALRDYFSLQKHDPRFKNSNQLEKLAKLCCQKFSESNIFYIDNTISYQNFQQILQFYSYPSQKQQKKQIIKETDVQKQNQVIDIQKIPIKITQSINFDQEQSIYLYKK